MSKNHVAEDILMHYGVSKLDGAPGRGSGRYPLGSGEEPNQHSGDFVSRVKKMRKEGVEYVDEDTGKVYKGDTAIAKIMGMSTTDFRAKYAIEAHAERTERSDYALKLYNEGKTPTEIARIMGYNNDSSARTLLNQAIAARKNQAMVTRDYLKKIVDEKGMIDVGKGVELECGVSREKFKEALAMLKMEGYEIHGRGLKQVTNKNQQTNLTVLCKPGTPHSDIYDTSKIHSVKDYDEMIYNVDGKDKIKPSFAPPASLDSKRVMIRYAEDGGKEKDGLVELKRGVEDISLGDSTNYSQVRILVDGTHYIKGMAAYNDNDKDFPPGVDVIFNTNKTKDIPMMGDKKDNTVLKLIGKDPKNPFNSLIKDAEHGGQRYYIDKDGKEKLSVINKRADEGDWSDWTKLLSSQFLAKQPVETAKRQIDISKADTETEYDEIMSLTNPTVKRTLLKTFADNCDSAAVKLKAATMPRQAWSVLLPIPSLKDNEVYAPNFKDGETLYLVRFPHEGTFQIPELKVNNKNPEGKRYITPNAKDAIGININVAQKLSGADFDGDTVLCIPKNSKIKIQSKGTLPGLEDYDPSMEYPYREGMKEMRNTQTEMGIISNLIADMTIKGASDAELAKAVRHSMCVIDAEKHSLDYKRSEKENEIAALKRKWQGHIGEDGKHHEGASTLITRAKSQKSVTKRKGSPIINPDGTITYKEDPHAEYPEKRKVKDPKTGEFLKDPATGKFIWEETGKTKTRMQQSTKMAETNDARTLISVEDTPIERLYADYANYYKRKAEEARRAYLNTGKLEYNPSAKKVYQEEVSSLESKLNIAKLNAPRERRAQAIANSVVEAKKQSNPDMTSKEIKKESQRALTEAREQVGAKRHPVEITPKEWEAIQSGAISDNKLQEILNAADIDKVRQMATPRTSKTNLPPAKVQLIKALKNSGYTNAEISDRLSISTSTVSKYL